MIAAERQPNVWDKTVQKKFVKQSNCYNTTARFLSLCNEKGNWEEIYHLAKGYIKEIEDVKNKSIPKKSEWGMKQYLRDKNNQKCGFLCAKVVDGRVKVYYSFCDTRYDKFDPNYEPKELNIDVKVPFSRWKDIDHFLKRVIRYYGKDGKVIIPNWIFDICV